jgi:hypothetical protein
LLRRCSIKASAFPISVEPIFCRPLCIASFLLSVSALTRAMFSKTFLRCSSTSSLLIILAQFCERISNVSKSHLHEQWRFRFLSRLTDFARLSVQFCQALWPILR